MRERNNLFVVISVGDPNFGLRRCLGELTQTGCVVVAVTLQPYCDRNYVGSEGPGVCHGRTICGWLLWRKNEADLSAQCAQAKNEAWFSRSHEYSGWTFSPDPPPSKEADAAFRVIEALSGRRSFERLRTEGMRRGRGPLRLVSRPAPAHKPTQSAKIGFSISRRVGNAVQRNRIRRRIRAILRDISRDNPSILPPGDYLFRVTSKIEHWSPAQLRNTVTEVLCSGPERPGQRRQQERESESAVSGAGS